MPVALALPGRPIIPNAVKHDRGAAVGTFFEPGHTGRAWPRFAPSGLIWPGDCQTQSGSDVTFNSRTSVCTGRRKDQLNTGPTKPSTPDPTPLATASGIDIWTSPAWRAEALAWVDAQLAAVNVSRTGPIDHERTRVYSTVFSVPTTSGRVWFKAAAPGTAFEVPLYLLLQQIAPHHALAPIAADPARGWLLLPDGGQPLADALAGPELADALVRFLPRYAELQRDLAPHADDLLALGLPDMRPAAMPERFDQALVIARPYVEEHGDDTERASFEAVAALRSQFTEWAARLAASPVPASLDHSDLHPGNILLPGGEPGADRLNLATTFDWGTSVLAHPFTGLLIPLRYVQRDLGFRSDDPTFGRVRDAYLEAFTDLAPRTELEATLEAAAQMGKVVRALLLASEARITARRSQKPRKQATQWLAHLLEAPYQVAPRRQGTADRPRRRAPKLTATRGTAPAPVDTSAASSAQPRDHQSGLVAWSNPAWRSEALAWIDAQLTAAHLARTGPPEPVRTRPGSVVLRVPTTEGQVWFKAAAPATAFEVPLHILLQRVAPGYALAPIAAYPARGWLLLPDGGPLLADTLSGPALADALVAFLPRYAQLQRDLAPHAVDLLGVGLPDMRPAVMPERFDEALAVARPFIERHGNAAERSRYDAVTALRPTFAAWSERLAASPVPISLDHGDLQPGNMLVPGVPPGEVPDAANLARTTAFDWGTSVVSHPFTSLLIPLRFLRQSLQTPAGHPAIDYARDAYLEVFSDLAPHANLVATVGVAQQMSKVHRALDWLALAREAGPQQGGMFRRALAWLNLLLEEPGTGED